MTDRIEDPQVRFYLERKELIDTWAKLAEREHRVADEFYTSLSETVESRLPEVDADAEVEVGTLGPESYIALRRPHWAVPGQHAVAMVALAWWPKSVSFTRLPDYSICVGVRVRRAQPFEEHHARAVAALQATEQLGAFASRGGMASNWLGWTYEPLTEPNWDDLSGYRQHLVNQLFAHWDSLAPRLDQALEPLLPTRPS